MLMFKSLIDEGHNRCKVEVYVSVGIGNLNLRINLRDFSTFFTLALSPCHSPKTQLQFC